VEVSKKGKVKHTHQFLRSNLLSYKRSSQLHQALSDLAFIHQPPNQQDPTTQLFSNKKTFSPSGTISTASSRCTARPESNPVLVFSPCLTLLLPLPSEYTVATAPHKNTTKTGVATLLNP
jgi:hypothetical protein